MSTWGQKNNNEKGEGEIQKMGLKQHLSVGRLAIKFPFLFQRPKLRRVTCTCHNPSPPSPYSISSSPFPLLSFSSPLPSPTGSSESLTMNSAISERVELAKLCSTRNWSKEIRVLDSLLTQSCSIQDIWSVKTFPDFIILFFNCYHFFQKKEILHIFQFADRCFFVLLRFQRPSQSV